MIHSRAFFFFTPFPPALQLPSQTTRKSGRKSREGKKDNRSILNPVSIIMKNHSLPRCKPHRNLGDGGIKEMNEEEENRLITELGIEGNTGTRKGSRTITGKMEKKRKKKWK